MDFQKTSFKDLIKHLRTFGKIQVPFKEVPVSNLTKCLDSYEATFDRIFKEIQDYNSEPGNIRKGLSKDIRQNEELRTKKSHLIYFCSNIDEALKLGSYKIIKS